MSDHVLAVDIGGTKIAAGVVDRAGRVVRQAVRPTREPVFDALRDAVTAVGPDPVAAVGLSCAGPVDAVAGTVSPINIPSWRDFPLRARVAELVTDVPIALAGDGQCMALGEHWLGAGRGATAMLGVVVSTGVGGGLVLDGRPFAGRSGNAGHVGHVIAEPAGDPCSCGARGCVETIASGPSLVRWACARGWRPAGGARLAATHGNPAGRSRTTPPAAEEAGDRGHPVAPGTQGPTSPAAFTMAELGAAAGDLAGPDPKGRTSSVVGTAEELGVAAVGGDAVALAAFRRGARALGLGVVAAAALCDLEMVVVGGGVAQVGDVLFEPLRQAVAEFAGLSYLADLRVAPATLGPGAGLVGAAALAFHAL